MNTFAQRSVQISEQLNFVRCPSGMQANQKSTYDFYLALL